MPRGGAEENLQRAVWLRQILDQFRLPSRNETVKQELHNQLQAASDPAVALELLPAAYRNRSNEQAPDTNLSGWAGGGQRFSSGFSRPQVSGP